MSTWIPVRVQRPIDYWPNTNFMQRSVVSEPVDEDTLLCGYSSKRCRSASTTKQGGGLHQFCEFHRLRANKNQQRIDHKRRAQRAVRRQQLRRAKMPHCSEKLTLPDPVDFADSETSLSAEDVAVFTAILFGVKIDDATHVSVPASLQPDS